MKVPLQIGGLIWLLLSLFGTQMTDPKTDKAVGTYPPKSSSKRERERERERERVQRHTPVRVWSHLCKPPVGFEPRTFSRCQQGPQQGLYH